MPGRFFLTETTAAIAAEFGADAGDVDDRGVRLDAAPGETVTAVLGGEGRRLVEMRWGMIPMGRRNARGRPVLEMIVNARGETLFAKSAFAGLRRCILPVSGWYEWTGTARRKIRWSISGQTGLLAFAATWDAWDAPGGGEVRSLATVTTEPNADVAAVHHRMPAILEPEVWPLWLEEIEGDASALLRPLPAGRLRIERL
jgi:putative SOS response-associated peptidase YedK